MICRYCGLETGAGISHCSQAECIQALNAEIERAKRLIGRSREASSSEGRQEREDTSSEHPERAYIEPA